MLRFVEKGRLDTVVDFHNIVVLDCCTQNLIIRFFIAALEKLIRRQIGMSFIAHRIAECRWRSILAQIRAHTAVHPPFTLILEAIDPQLTGSLEPGTPAWHIGFGITAFEFPRALSRNTETLPQVHGDALFLDRQSFHVLEIMWAISAGRFSQHHQPHLLFLRYFLRTADFR